MRMKLVYDYTVIPFMRKKQKDFYFVFIKKISGIDLKAVTKDWKCWPRIWSIFQL